VFVVKVCGCIGYVDVEIYCSLRKYVDADRVCGVLVMIVCRWRKYMH
jgi:hypothetical protein